MQRNLFTKLCCLLLFLTPMGMSELGAQTYMGDSVGDPIPDVGTVGTFTSTINVPVTGTIGAGATLDQLTLDLTHTFDADLDITLIAPSGESLELSSDNGGSGDDYTGTVFQDGGSNITAGTPPFSGIFEPQGGTFATAFAGVCIQGDWTLEIIDDTGGDSGTFLGTSITFTTDGGACGAGPPPPSACTGYNGDSVGDPIPDVGTTGSFTSTINVPDAGTIGVDAAIESVELDLTHTFDADLDISLIAPGGSPSIDLSSDNGGAGDNYTGTIFTDDASMVISAGAPPFTGMFLPEGGDLNTVFAGVDINGDWTLEIIDDTGGDSGTFLGVTLNICAAADPCATDSENPMITCPGNTTVQATGAICAPVANNIDPIATDNCTMPPAITYEIDVFGDGSVPDAAGGGSLSGFSFPIGVHTLTYIATDDAGLTANCSFTVTVEDNTACGCGNPQPGDSCDDGDMTTNNDVIQADCSCAGTIDCDVAAPVAGVTTKSFCPDPDLSPSLGNTGISVGNTLSANETVVWVLTGAPMGSGLTVGTEYTSTGCASGFNNYGLLAVANSSRVIRVQDPGNAVPGDYTFEALVEDCNNASCRSATVSGFTITVIDDTEPPMANCPSPASGPNILTNASFEVNDGNDTPFSTDYTPFGPVFALDATITPTASAATGTFFLKMFGAVSGIFQDHPVTPGDNVTATVDVINASFDPMQPGCRGLVKVEFLDAGGVEISETEGNIVDHTIPSNTSAQSIVYAVAPAGAVTVRYVAVMLCDAGGAVFFDNASLQVSSGDTGGTFVFANDPGQCGAVFNFDIPAPSDNCGSATSMADVPSGSLFDVGTTPVTVTATDGAGNSSTCSFSVTVNDTEAPVANCPEPATGGGNLLTNGSFEENDGFDQPFINNDWTAFDVASAVRSLNAPPVAQDGSWFLKMFGANTGIFQDVPVTPGENLTASVFLRNASFDPMQPGCTGFLKLEYINSGGGIFSVEESTKLDDTTPQDVWTEITLNSTVPAGAVAVRVVVIMQCPMGGAVFFDNATLVSDAPPTPGDFTINYMPGQCGATVDFTVPPAMDNCPGATATPSIPSGSFFDVGSTPLTVTAMDASGNTSTCMVNVVVEDTEMPMPACLDATVNFTGQPAIGVPIAQLYDAAASTDNCGTVNLVSPIADPIVACEQLGEVIDVPIVVNDGNGNEGTCIATITVTGIPCGWTDNGGIACGGSTSNFDTGVSEFSLTAGSCAPAYPYTADATSFVFTELCGDGEIIAKVEGISGGQGFAGVMARDSEAPGSPKVSIGTNTINRVRKEVRAIANFPSFPQAVLAYDQFWVRIMRTGPSFKAFASPDGVQWFQYIFQNIQMGDCIKVGLFAYNEKANSPITATFSNVSVNGVPVGALDGGSTTTTFAQSFDGAENGQRLTPDITLYPNPTNDELNLNLQSLLGEAATISIFNVNGQLMEQVQYDAIEEVTTQLNVAALPAGTYFVNVKTDQTYESLRFVKQ